jgi:hypothetical protein
MSSIIKASDENANRLTRVFQELLDTLPPGAAVLGSNRTKNDDGTIVWLKPARKHAAEFRAHIDDGYNNLIDVSFGASTTFELPSESRLPDDASFDMLLEAVRAMGLATMAGRCREYFGFMGIRGTIEVSEGNALRCSSFFHPRLLPKLVRYEPYV